MSYAEDEGFDGWWPDEYPENYAYAVLSKRRFIKDTPKCVNLKYDNFFHFWYPKSLIQYIMDESIILRIPDDKFMTVLFHISNYSMNKNEKTVVVLKDFLLNETN